MVLRDLDTAGCDTALFSLFSYVPRAGFSPFESLEGLRHLKAVCLEEFTDEEDRIPGRYAIFHKNADGWHEYALRQRFGTTSGMDRGDISDFVQNEIPKRVVGNCCMLICGETNGVKYSPRDKQVHDAFGLRAAIPSTAKVILNPVHDRMTRFEMKLKRCFLSENDRWVISVWNKGKSDRNGRVRDGVRAAWTVYHDGEEATVAPISNELHLEIGIVDVS